MSAHIKLIDTHCHLDLDVFDHDRTRVIEQASAVGIEAFIVPGVLASGWSDIEDLARDCTSVYAAYGLHPQFVENHNGEDLRLLDQWLSRHSAVAVGEIGLDFTARESDRQGQLFYFTEQLALAKQHDLPVILHVRKAHDDVIRHLVHSGIKGGTVHAFNGSLQQADRYIDLGFKLGFGGMLTYPRSSRLRKLASCLPLEAIVLETDAPDMTGAAHQGKRNSPEYLPEILAALAAIRPESAEDIAGVTTLSARKLFQLPLSEEVNVHGFS